MGGVSTPEQTRPRQVTMAGWMVMLGSGFVVVNVFDRVSRLRSLQTREAIEEFLAEPPGAGMGLSVESVISLMQTVAMVAAACATAAAILGWYVLRRNRQARLALSIVAVPLFFSGMVAGGFLSSLVVAATAMLWLSPSREWFAEGGTAQRNADARDPSSPGFRGTVAPERSAPPAPPATAPAPGAPTTAGPTPPARGPQDPYRYGEPPSAPASPAGARPDAVNIAFVLTAAVAGLVLAMVTIAVAATATSPDLVLEEMRRQRPDLAEQGIDGRTLRATVLLMGSVTMAWAGLAVVLAVLMLGRRPWARTGLLVSSTLCTVASVLGTLGSLLLVVPALASIAVVACLRRPEVRAWFAAPR